MTLKESGKKQNLCPFKLEEELETLLQGAPRTITSGGPNSYLIEVGSKVQNDRIFRIIQILEAECKVKEHPYFNSVKTVIYLQRDEVQDLQCFSEGMKREYNITEITPAPWIVS